MRKDMLIALAIGMAIPRLVFAQTAPSACMIRHQATAAEEAKDRAILASIQTDFRAHGYPALNAHLDDFIAMVGRTPSDLDAPCDGVTYVRARDVTMALLLSAVAAKGNGPHPQVAILAFSPYAQSAFLAGAIYVERGDWNHAETMLRRGLELAPNDAPISNEEALTLSHLGKPVEAVALVDKAMSANPLLDKPLHARLLRTRGYALGDAGRFDEAIVAYQQSLTFEPNHGGALNEIAYLTKRKAGGSPGADVTYHGEQAKSMAPQN